MATQPLSFQAPYISHLLQCRPCCSSKRVSLEIMTQTSSRSLARSHGIIQHLHMFRVHRKEWQPPSRLISSPFVSLPFFSPFLSSRAPSIHPSLPPSLPKPCSAEGRLTQHFQPGVYEYAQESAHSQDYSQ